MRAVKARLAAAETHCIELSEIMGQLIETLQKDTTQEAKRFGMFNFFKKASTFDPIQRGGEAVRHASKLAQLVPFRYLLGNETDGSVTFTQYTGVFVEQDKVHIMAEEERAAVAALLADMRRKNTPAEKHPGGRGR